MAQKRRAGRSWTYRAKARALAMEIADQLTERRLVQDVQHLTQLLVACYPEREVGAVGLTQRREERVAVFPIDFTILIAVPLIETGLLHGG